MKMRTMPVVAALAVCLVFAGFARGEDVISLPAPARTGGVALADALAQRESSRDFADVDLTPQQLSDLLWATAGVNRPDGKKVYPVATNRQDMTVYAVTRQGAYRYDPAANALILVAAGDHRAKTGTQPYVGGCAVNLAYVQDMSLWNERPELAERGKDWGFAHAGELTQNAYLYAAGQGWSAVIRGLFEQDVLKELFGLPADQYVRLVHSVGPKQ